MRNYWTAAANPARVRTSFVFDSEGILNKGDFSMNLQISFPRRPALAVLLTALSASALLAQGNPAQVNTVRIKGAFQTRTTAVLQSGILQANGSGAGTASHIGPFTFTEKATVDLATGLSTGVFQLTSANGDMINGSFVGRAQPDNVPTGSHFIGLLVITGGTGRFRGATGGFTMDRFFDDTNVPIFNLGYGSLTGTISTPASNK